MTSSLEARSDDTDTSGNGHNGGSTTYSEVRPASTHSPLAPAAASYVGVILAVATTALGVVGIRDGILAAGWIDGTPWIPAAIDWVDGLSFAGWMIPAGIALAILGLVLVVVALKRRRRIGVPMKGQTAIFLKRRDVGKIAAAAARSVPGVLDAGAKAGPKTVRIRASTTGDDDGISQRVRGAVDHALDCLARPAKVKLRMTTKGP